MSKKRGGGEISQNIFYRIKDESMFRLFLFNCPGQKF